MSSSIQDSGTQDSYDSIQFPVRQRSSGSITSGSDSSDLSHREDSKRYHTFDACKVGTEAPFADSPSASHFKSNSNYVFNYNTYGTSTQQASNDCFASNSQGMDLCFHPICRYPKFRSCIWRLHFQLSLRPVLPLKVRFRCQSIQFHHFQDVELSVIAFFLASHWPSLSVVWWVLRLFSL